MVLMQTWQATPAQNDTWISMVPLNRPHRTIGIILAICLPLVSALAQPAPTLPFESCQTPPHPSWSNVEHHIWNSFICVNQAADLSERSEEDRRISARFLRTILFNDPWRSAAPAKGVRLIGAIFDEPVDLENVKIEHDLVLDRTVFLKPVSLITANIEGDLSFDDSSFKGGLEAEGISVSRSLFLNRSELTKLELTRAKVGGTLHFDDIRITGPLTMGVTTVGAGLLARRANLRDIDLVASKIGGNLELVDAKIEGRLEMDSAVVGAHVIARHVEIGEANLDYAKVVASVDLTNAHVSGLLNLNRSELSYLSLQGGNLYKVSLTGAKLSVADFVRVSLGGALELSDANITANLFLREASLQDVSIISSRVGGNIELSDSKIGGKLEMDSTIVGAHVLASSAQINEARLSYAKVSASVDLTGVQISGQLDLDRTDIAYLSLRGAKLSKVSLIGAKLAVAAFDDANLGGALEIQEATVTSNLVLRGAVLQNVDLSYSKIGSNVDLIDARLVGVLDMRSTIVGSYLFAYNAQFADVDLRAAKIGTIADMSRAKLSGRLHMARTEIGLLRLQDASLTQVSLGGAKLSAADLVGAKLTQALEMQDVDISTDLFLNHTILQDVKITNSKIGGAAELSDAHIEGILEMQNTTIGATLVARRSRLTRPANWAYLSAGQIWLEGAKLVAIDLTGGTIRGLLALSNEVDGPVSWSRESSLTLRNATSGLLVGSRESWPASLDLRGFHYQGFGGGAPADDMINYSKEDLLDWMRRSKPFSPQPYEHLAQLLAKDGDVQRSREVLFSAREEERKQSQGVEWWLKLASLLFIGHSHRLYYVFGWIILLVSAGAVILWWSEEARRLELGTGIAFSFDRLIPLIKLEEKHYKVDLIPSVRNYFYVHQIMGYILASFVVAWVSGILK
jgi:uncharacterized protein YjbI with pentapeptide repeats